MAAPTPDPSETAIASEAFGRNAWLVEQKYREFVADPTGVSPAWRDFFGNYRSPADRIAAPSPQTETATPLPATPSPASEGATDLPDNVVPAELKGAGKGWHWQKLDLTYWKKDDIHIELTTANDAAVETRNEERSIQRLPRDPWR